MTLLQKTIDEAFERRAEITPRNVDAQLKEAINTVIEYLDQGKLRVAEKINGVWVTHQWIKKRCYCRFALKIMPLSKAALPIISTKCHRNLLITIPKNSVKVASAWCRPPLRVAVLTSLKMWY